MHTRFLFFTLIIFLISNLILPTRAFAVNLDKGIPFSGIRTNATYCTCSQTWLLTIMPIPPSVPLLLIYRPYSQLYPMYNVPTATYIMGKYIPGIIPVFGVCLMLPFCTPVPSYGLMTPFVSSF